MNNLEEKLNTIDNLKRKLDELRPLSADTTKNLKIHFDTKIINNSIRGKGNTFTYQEIKDLLEGSIICEKKDCEHLEIVDYKNALDYIVELSEKKITKLNATNILNIHTILFRNIDPENGGKYRNGQAWVSSGNEDKDMVCDPLLIPNEMNNFFNWLFSEKKEHSLIIASDAHNKFVSIHPFVDGNGRTGRLIMNLILQKDGYVPVIIKSYKRKEKYDDAIKSWKNGEKENFYIYIADCEIESLEECLEIIQRIHTSDWH